MYGRYKGCNSRLTLNGFVSQDAVRVQGIVLFKAVS